MSGRVLEDEDMMPVWSFSIADTGGPWCWTGMGIDGMLDLLPRLQNFESMTWTEIAQGTGSHSIPFRGLCSRAQKRLRDIRQDDVEELFSLRMCGQERVWGIRVGRVMRLLWWDPKHQVYPYEKNHT